MSVTGKSDLHDFVLQLHHETHPQDANSGALLVSDDGDRKRAVWLPKAQCEFELKGRGLVKVTCPEWLAVEKGLL